MSLQRAALACIWLACAVAPAGETAPAPYVPAELEPWRAWVLHGEEFRECPFLFDEMPVERGAHRCAWPGVLRLDAGAKGATFAQSWQVYAAGFAPLPGDAQHWPQEVTAGGRALAVSTHAEHPAVWLEPGRHEVSGRFVWERAPATLPLAPRTGRLELTVAGAPVAWPQRTAETVWLGEGRAQATPEADALRIQVRRLISDGIPLTLTTRIQLDVAGAGREALLARALPAGFVPMQLTSPLPARIEGDDRLRVQLRPGAWQIELLARADALPDALTLEPGEGEWAGEEIWSYASAERLRVTAPEGANPVDPAQVGVPPEWQGWPAFRLVRGDALRIVERSRGLPDALENQLTLERALWRDYSSDGYTIEDAIRGRVETDWRLDLALPYRLGSAQASGRDVLITRGATEEMAGVEVRDGNLDLRAVSRLERASGRMPATGWQQRFDSVTLTLHLPAGQRLLAAPGTDYAPDTWLHDWRLLDFFLVLFIALAVGRLVTPLYGGVALLMLIVIYQEPGAPVWIWLALLLAVALVRFAPDGRLQRAARVLRLLAFLALGLVAVPFVAAQLRAALYPQLDAGVGLWSTTDSLAMQSAPAVYPESAEEMVVTDMGASVSALKRSAVESRLDYAPSVLVQSGPAVPAWSGVVYNLGWSGPVSADDELRLVILGSFAYRCVRVLGVLLIAAVAYALARASFGGFRWPPRLRLGAAAPLIALAISGLLGAAPEARADTPDPQLLRELKERLLAPPECAPRCAEIASARVRVEADALTIELDVEALARVALPLPGALRAWEPRSVDVDGVPREWLYRGGDDEPLLLAVEAGAHTVALRGPLPPLASLRIPFPEPPRYIAIEASGWSVSGVADGQLVSGALALERNAGERAGDERKTETLVAGAVAPYVRVTRVLSLASDWSVLTRAERIAPADGAFTIEIPLLAGESVTTDAPVRDARVLASFGPDQPAFGWRSTLAQSERLVLTAGSGPAYVEVWQIVVGAAWRVTHDGSPLIASGEQSWTPEFHPRPGESLTLEVSRPAALEGPTLTFDSVSLRTVAGQRVVDGELDLQYRSTRGGQHTLRLGAAARVVEVTSDGEALAVRPHEGELTLPIRPGLHAVRIVFQEERGSAVLARTAAVDLGQESGNVSLTLAFGSERWVLFTRGPWEGPAVLLWGELIVFLLLAPLLARLPGMPLRTHQWVLLGIGFSTFAWSMLALLAVWFLAMAWRERGALPALRWRYNLMQIGLAALTFATLLGLLSTILWGALLGQPDMHIVGNGSTASELRWFVDRSAGALPQGSAVSLPRWVYQAAILSWALWLSFELLRWLPWAWRAWNREGIWRGRAAS